MEAIVEQHCALVQVTDVNLPPTAPRDVTPPHPCPSPEPNKAPPAWTLDHKTEPF